MTHKDIIKMNIEQTNEFDMLYDDYVVNCYNDVEMLNNMTIEEFEAYRAEDDDCAIAFCDGVALLWAVR